MGAERLARELGGEHGVLGGLAARGVGQELHPARQQVDEALLLAGKADAADRGGRHLGTARGERVEEDLSVRISGGAEKQPGAKRSVCDLENIGHHALTHISPTLPGEHDFDRVAGRKGRIGPIGARHHPAVHRHRNPPHVGRNLPFRKQGRDGVRAQRLVLAVDADEGERGR